MLKKAMGRMVPITDFKKTFTKTPHVTPIFASLKSIMSDYTTMLKGHPTFTLRASMGETQKVGV
jgi:hypothetical protein